MNIGHDLMRRFGPRRTGSDGEPAPARPASRVLALVLLAGGIASFAALGWAGRASESLARLAAVLALFLLGWLAVAGVVAWARAPVHDHSQPDAGDVLDRMWVPGFVRWWGGFPDAWARAPVRSALAVVAVLALGVAFSLALHWRWIPDHGGRRGPRGALAPPAAAPAAPGGAPASRP